MEQQTGPTVDDEPLNRLWKRCRLVGLINKILCYIGLFNVSMLLLVTVCGVIFCHVSGACESLNDRIPMELLWVAIILLCLILAVIIKLIYVNNYLRSTKIPTDGNKVKVWLCYHRVFLVLSVLSCIAALFNQVNNKTSVIFSNGISIIFLVVELNVVGKFNKAFNMKPAVASPYSL